MGKGKKRYEVRKTDGKWYVLEVNPKKWRHSFVGCWKMPDAETAVRTAMKYNAALLEREQAIADRRAKKNDARRAALAHGHPYKVGQLFSYSWGYDQTNVEFFECVEVGPKSIKVRPIASHSVPRTQGFMSESVGPCPGKYIGEAVTKIVQTYTDNGKTVYNLRMDFGNLNPIQPESTQYASWYA